MPSGPLHCAGDQAAGVLYPGDQEQVGVVTQLLRGQRPERPGLLVDERLQVVLPSLPAEPCRDLSVQEREYRLPVAAVELAGVVGFRVDAIVDAVHQVRLETDACLALGANHKGCSRPQ